MKLEHHYIVTDNVKLHYVDKGDPANKPIILLHTLQDCASNWGPLMKQLSSDYRTLALDYRGHGESDWVNPNLYLPDNYASDVEALILNLDLENVILIGHSIGTRIAIEYAKRNPSNVTAIIALDYDFALTSEHELSNLASRKWDSFDTLIENLRHLQPNSDPMILKYQALNLAKKVDGGKIIWRSDPAALHFQNNREPIHPLLVPTCPILIIQGRQSLVLSHEQAIKSREAAKKAWVVELEGAGHWLHQEIPEAVTSTIRWFFDISKA